MRNALVIVLLLMLSSLFAAESAQPLYFIDDEIPVFSGIIVQDSTIYALAANVDDLYLYEFDLQLNLQSKVKVFERIFFHEFLPYQDSFLLINREHTEFTCINKQGKLLDRLKLKGSNIIEFEKDGQKQIITWWKNQIYLYKMNSELSQSEERLILEPDIDWTPSTSGWKLYFDDNYCFLFYQSKNHIIRYSFKDDWVLYHQAAIIEKNEEKYCSMKIEKNRIIFSAWQGDWCITYDFEGNLISRGIKEPEPELEPQEEIIFTQSELKDSLSIISTTGDVNFELLTDFCLSFGDYAIIDNQKIIIAASKSHFADCGLYNESMMLILDSPNSELYLSQNSDADRLNAAYAAGDVTLLADLFSNWQMKNSPETGINAVDYEGETYLLFSQIYPELYKIHREQGNKYHTIKADIKVTFTDTIRITDLINYTLEMKSTVFNLGKFYNVKNEIVIHDFHPAVNIEKEIIYVDKPIREALLIYFSKSGKDDKDVKKRMSFLNRYVSVQGFHWLGKPKLYSQPAISSIVFEAGYDKAIFTYDNVNSSGSFLCHKIDGKWQKGREIAYEVQNLSFPE
ncbi:MAG: hypothetical protein K9M99_08615 [Candidatus Cloacimonetes bacterium]|nr:hypothetical protein [Candidatus Cloacimonadota bacterium]